MLDTLRESLAHYYLIIKFIHLFFVMIWSWSTSVAYTWYVKGALVRWQKKPNDVEAIQRRNFAMEQFDKGAVLEHIAFPIILITGPLLYWLGGWTMASSGWLALKLAIVTFIFIPMEIIDYWLAHFGGNKAMLRKKGLMQKYEKAMQQHWLFLRVSTPLIIITMPLVIFLAVVKPF
jgi:uncharacterized membrane protein